MLYLHSSSDGSGTEGIGAVLQYQLFLFHLARVHGCQHLFAGFSNLLGDPMPEGQFDAMANRYVNMPSRSVPPGIPMVPYSGEDIGSLAAALSREDAVVTFAPQDLWPLMEHHVRDESLGESMRQLRRMLCYDGPSLFQPGVPSAIAHVRVWVDGQDRDRNDRRDLLAPGHAAGYLAAFEMVRRANPGLPVDMHAVCQRENPETRLLESEGVRVHYGNHTITDLHHMVHADYLITSNSSFSYVAHLLGDHTGCIARRGFFHSWRPSCAIVDRFGAPTGGPAAALDRTGIINRLCRAASATSYLEIGVKDAAAFAAVECARKVGVSPDPSPAATHTMSSDEFFESNTEMFDVIFVDGIHTEEQVARDVANSLRSLRPDGYVVCHDMNPTTREMQSEQYAGGAWTGQGWKHFARLRMTRPDLEMFVVDCDWGCGVIARGSQETIPWVGGLDYSHLEADRASILNLVSPAQFLARFQ